MRQFAKALGILGAKTIKYYNHIIGLMGVLSIIGIIVSVIWLIWDLDSVLALRVLGTNIVILFVCGLFVEIDKKIKNDKK